MRVDLLSRFSSYKHRSDISRRDSDGQPLIHHVPSTTAPPTTFEPRHSTSGERDGFRKPLRSGSYILLDDKSKDDPASPTLTKDVGHGNAFTEFLSRNKLFLGCLLPLFSVLFELGMLSLFLYIYLSLPMVR
jgi:hypothetical protein